VKRGSIIDRNGEYISESKGTTGEYERIYHYPTLSPIIGYTHPYYGQAGIEASLDPILRGLENQNPWTIWFNHLLYGQPPPGLDVRISIDMKKHTLVEEMMAEKPGAVILLDVETGQILVMVSAPTYNANQLDEIWDELIVDENSPLVNRVTQGSYPPGTALEPFLFAASEMNIEFDDYVGFFADLGFYSSPDIRLPTMTHAAPETFKLAEMLVSPLQMAIGAATLNNNGEMIKPEYLIETKNPEGEWEGYISVRESKSIFNGIIAHTVVESMIDENLPVWHLTSIATTDDGSQVTWFVGGTTPEVENNYVVVVVIEEQNKQLAGTIGKSLLTNK
jgi:cell division protein FtsI/penicillin-binding protein 2